MSEVRRIRLADATSFRECLHSVAAESGHLLTLEAPPVERVESFVRLLLAEDLPQYVAVDGPRVVGWCDIRREEPAGMEHVGILGMGVLANYRRRGLGRRLMQRCLDHAPLAGFERVGLEVFARNTGAIALYESLGFQHEGRRRHAFFRDGFVDDLVLMAWFAPGVELAGDAGFAPESSAP
jgi:ribosomal protein S18 acetylase RimI-like enzyme